ncbi:MAG TPA: putative ABC transporter permease [Mogibacterium sp.]|nr:putative ABC transporter permease [Mogibacterium sp.]
MLYLMFYFHIYAFLGWCLEVIFHQLKEGKFINRGMLSGPYCPIYGFGMTFLIISTRSMDNNFFKLFLIAFVLCSVLELVIGFMMNKVFHERWWDYSKEPFNIGGYICLRFSLIWGIAGAVTVKEIHPIFEKFAHWMPDKLLIVSIILLSVSMFVDTVNTVNQILKLNRDIDELISIQNNMRIISNKIGEQISRNTAKITDKMNSALANPEFQEHIDRVHKKLSRSQRRLLKSYPNIKGTKSELQEKILRQWVEKTGKGKK